MKLGILRYDRNSWKGSKRSNLGEMCGMESILSLGKVFLWYLLSYYDLGLV